MERRNSILILAKLFFVLIVMCCFSCNIEKTNNIEETKNVIGLKIATISSKDNMKKDIYTYVIDSCEYIGFCQNYHNDVLAHKGNCKYCAKRLKDSNNPKNQ